MLSSQNLSTEETWAMVRAMESNVEVLALGLEGYIKLDITVLSQYSGQGSLPSAVTTRLNVCTLQTHAVGWVSECS